MKLPATRAVVVWSAVALAAAASRRTVLAPVRPSIDLTFTHRPSDPRRASPTSSRNSPQQTTVDGPAELTPCYHGRSPIAPFTRAGLVHSADGMFAAFSTEPLLKSNGSAVANGSSGQNRQAAAATTTAAAAVPAAVQAVALGSVSGPAVPIWGGANWEIPTRPNVRIENVRDFTARHREYRDSGIRHNLTRGGVAMVVGWTEVDAASPSGSPGRCVIVGLSFVSGVGRAAQWNATVDNCVSGAAPSALAVSDDGTTVVWGVRLANVSTLLAYNAQSGSLRTTSSLLPTINASHSGSASVIAGISCDASCTRVAVTVGAAVHVLNTTSGDQVTPVILADTSAPAALCPMGNFLISGRYEVTVRKWDAGLGTYSVRWTTNMTRGVHRDEVSPWLFAGAAQTVNGENLNTNYGCSCALAWEHRDGRTIRIDVYSMLRSSQILTWVSPPNTGGSLKVAALAMHYNYLAVATSGDFPTPGVPSTTNTSTPQVLLFQFQATENPVATYRTPGSMMSVDLYVEPAIVPPAESVRAQRGKSRTANRAGSGAPSRRKETRYERGAVTRLGGCIANTSSMIGVDNVQLVVAGTRAHILAATVDTGGGDSYAFKLGCFSVPN